MATVLYFGNFPRSDGLGPDSKSCSRPAVTAFVPKRVRLGTMPPQAAASAWTITSAMRSGTSLGRKKTSPGTVTTRT